MTVSSSVALSPLEPGLFMNILPSKLTTFVNVIIMPPSKQYAGLLLPGSPLGSLRHFVCGDAHTGPEGQHQEESGLRPSCE